MSRLARALAALPLLAGALHAQPPADDAAPVVAAVQRLFDGLARRDTAALRALIVPGTRFVAIAPDRPTSAPRAESDSAMLRDIMVGNERLLERMWNPVVQVQGTIATLWAPYDFHVDGKFSHCGVDTATLLRLEGRWRIAALVYTVQRTGCEPSPLGPPAP